MDEVDSMDIVDIVDRSGFCLVHCVHRVHAVHFVHPSTIRCLFLGKFCGPSVKHSPELRLS